MNAAATFPLTSAAWLGNSDLPQNVGRRSRRLCRAPHGEKSGFSCFVSNPARGASSGWCYILTGQRPVSVRTGGLPTTGERCSVFFCAQIPKSRCSMFHIITTSRTTRALHRLQFLAERSASILALAAVFFMAFVGVTA